MRRDRRSFRPSRRRHLGAALAASFVGVALALSSTAGCEGDAVGVEACTQIEQHRCQLAPACAGKAGIPDIKDEVAVQNCKDLYRDHCLVGIENVSREPNKDEVDACLAALTATTDCQKAGVTEMSACLGVVIDDGSVSPCAAFAHPERLAACKFIQSTSVAATTSSTTAASSSSSGTGGAGGGS